MRYGLDLDGGKTAIAETSVSRDPLEFFEGIKQGFLDWRKPLGSGKHSLSVHGTIPRRAESYRKLLADFCRRWNRDPALRKFRTTHVEIMLSLRDEAWLGCSTAADAVDKTRRQRAMYVVDYADRLEKIEAMCRDLEKKERQRRRNLVISKPVKLPRNIATEIAAYLRLEYGETRGRKGSLKASELKFDGEHVVDGVPTQFWRYPSSGRQPAWATVERFDDHYALGMTDKKPK
jgi:hypothetical protein